MTTGIKDLVIHNKIEEIKHFTTEIPQEYNQGLIYACLYGRLEIVKVLIDNNSINNSLNNALNFAFLGGHMDVISFLLEHKKLAIKKNLLFDAIIGNNEDPIHFLIKKRILKNFTHDDWYLVLCYAASTGNLNIVKLFLSKNRKSKNRFSADLEFVMRYAIYSNHIEIVKLMINIANIENVMFNYSYALSCAAVGGNMDIFLIIKKIVDEDDDGYFDYFNDRFTFDCAAYGGNINIIKFLLSRADFKSIHWAPAIKEAARGGHINMVQFLLDEVSKANLLNYVNLDLAMEHAAENGFLDIVQLLMSYDFHNWDLGMAYAAKGGHMDIVQLMITHGRYSEHHNANWYWAMDMAEKGGNLDIFLLMKEKLGSNRIFNKNVLMDNKTELEKYKKKLLQEMQNYKISKVVYHITDLCEDLLSMVIEYL